MRFASISLGLLLAACGSRSALLEGASSAGAAGTGATAGVGGATGGGGVGAYGGGGVGAYGGGGVGAFGGGGAAGVGGATACFGLFPLEPEASVAHEGGWSDGPPELAPSSDDGSQLTVAFVSAKSTGSGAKQLRHASLAPWQIWPPPLPVAPAYSAFVSTELASDFAVGASTNGNFAVAVAHVPPGGSPFVSFAPEVSATGSGSGGNVTLPSAGLPVFVERGDPGRHLVAVSDGAMLQASVVQTFGSGFNVTPVLLACGQNAKIADAARFGSSWVVALANEKTAPPPPSCSAAANGPTRLDLVLVGFDGAVTPIMAIEEQTPITRVAVAPHPTGAHVVWRVASGGIVAPLEYMRLDVGDASAWGPVAVSAPGDFPLDDFDVAALGPTAAAIAWGNDPAGNPPDLTVTVISDSGNPMASYAFEPPFFGPLAIAAGPSGSNLIVGWREQSSAPNEAVVKLRRLGCFGED